jgi:protein-S-isoprenylcysteine O-methyltransferase Ste14
MMTDQQRKIFAILGSAIFLLIAPLTVAGIVPWWITHWKNAMAFGKVPVLRVLGIVLILAGVPMLLDSFARFAIQGLGTPAPVFPTRHLVVQGLYRYVRNPMYVALVVVVLGQTLLFGSVDLLEYDAILWLGFHVFVLAYEEPTMRATFGDEYKTFCANVPRWIPRLRPWEDGA